MALEHFEYITRASTLIDSPRQVQAQLMDERDRALEDYLLRNTTPTRWTALTLLNGWTNSAGPDQPAQYRRIGDMVQTRGHCQAGTLGVAMFQLPVGFRPPANLDLAANPVPSSSPGRLWFKSNGDVFAQFAVGATQVSWFAEFSVTP